MQTLPPSLTPPQQTTGRVNFQGGRSQCLRRGSSRSQPFPPATRHCADQAHSRGRRALGGGYLGVVFQPPLCPPHTKPMPHPQCPASSRGWPCQPWGLGKAVCGGRAGNTETLHPWGCLPPGHEPFSAGVLNLFLSVALVTCYKNSTARMCRDWFSACKSQAGIRG